MGLSCCSHAHLGSCHEGNELPRVQRRTLYSLLAINIVMLGVELWGVRSSHSSGILADSLHLLSHVLVVSLSLFALSRGVTFRLRAVLIKGFLMVTLGIGSLVEVLSGRSEVSIPHADVMGWTMGLVFIFNLICLGLLWPRRADDLNMRSTWLCSFNDLLTNLGLIAASLLVSVTGSGVPDIFMGVLFSLVVTWTSFRLVMRTFGEMRVLKDQEQFQFTPAKTKSLRLPN